MMHVTVPMLPQSLIVEADPAFRTLWRMRIGVEIIRRDAAISASPPD